MTPSRRELLRTLALAGAGLATGWATLHPVARRRRLPAVRVDARREIRTVVTVYAAVAAV